MPTRFASRICRAKSSDSNCRMQTSPATRTNARGSLTQAAPRGHHLSQRCGQSSCLRSIPRYFAPYQTPPDGNQWLDAHGTGDAAHLDSKSSMDVDTHSRCQIAKRLMKRVEGAVHDTAMQAANCFLEIGGVASTWIARPL